MKTTLFILILFFISLPFHSQTTVCQGQSKNYSVDDADGTSGTVGSTYTWSIVETSFAGNLDVATDDTNDVDIDWATTPIGTYTIEVIEENGDNCIGIPVQHTVEILPLPNEPLVQSTNGVCLGSEGEFTITGDPNSTISYTINGGSPETQTLDANGTFTLVLSDIQNEMELVINDIDNGTCARNDMTGVSATITILASPQTSDIAVN